MSNCCFWYCFGEGDDGQAVAGGGMFPAISCVCRDRLDDVVFALATGKTAPEQPRHAPAALFHVDAGLSDSVLPRLAASGVAPLPAWALLLVLLDVGLWWWLLVAIFEAGRGKMRR